MTPKEALKMIDVIADEIGVWLFDSLAKEGFYLDDLRNHIRNQEQTNNELEALKKPPTADEVCKALSKQLKQKVSYGAKQFYYVIENTKCVMFVTETYGDGLWSINEYLPPHLITMIGRFYEGLEVKE